MGLFQINHNIPSLNAMRNQGVNSNALTKALEQLSSGLRINRAADDAAGLTISEKMREQINGLIQASRNAQDGISMVQTAEGALGEVQSVTQRINELSVQAANGVLTTDDRQAIQGEINQLVAQVDQTIADTEFNGKPLLDGTLDAQLQVGANSGQTVQVNVSSMSAASLGLTGINVTTTGGAAAAINATQGATSMISDTRSQLGATQNRLESAITNLQVSAENLTASESMIRDADYALQVSQLIRSGLLQQSSLAILSQSGKLPQGALNLLK